MKGTIFGKILQNHLVSGNLTPGEVAGIKIDQTLTQDATGTMAYLEFEAMGIPVIKTELSIRYIDHNTTHIGDETIKAKINLTKINRNVILADGMLNYIGEK